MSDFLQWIDLIWLPVAMAVVHKGQHLYAASYFIFCAIMLRLQVELMDSIGYTSGILPFMASDLFTRGVVVYSIFHALYLLLAHFSPGSNKHVFMAASLTIFFAALFTSTIIMVL